MSVVKIAGRLIGQGKPCFIIAEAGVNHNGDIKLAKKLIDVAKAAGADAVKFQTFKTEEVVIQGAEKAKYQQETTGAEESQFDMLKKLELTAKEFKELSNYAREKGILFLSTPDDTGSVDLLDELGVPAFKIGSGEVTNFPLLKYIAGKKKPIILSTGMSNLEEIGKALEVIRGEGVKDIVLLHCVTSYPAKIEDTNLKAMATLRQAFELPVGLSDHTVGITIPIAAVALGACIIEKHFTLDKNLPGPDHKASLEPEELSRMVKAIRDVEKSLGDGIKKPTSEEEEIKKVVRRSIVSNVDIPKGTVITKDMLSLKRPGYGLSAQSMNLIIGCRSSENIKSGEIISLSKVK